MKPSNCAVSYLTYQKNLKEVMRAAGKDARKQRQLRENLKPENKKDVKEG